MRKSILICVALLLIGSLGVAAVPNEQLVTFQSADGTTLGGTFTLPPNQKVGASFPAVLLIAGSGPTDRDGNQPPQLITDLLKQIAQELARHNIISFRFDKRAAHVNQMQWPTAQERLAKFLSWQNHQNDAQAAFQTLRTWNHVDVHRMAILGHSEGGLLALSLAKSLSPKSLILIGTPGRTFGQVLTEQLSALLDKQGATPAVKNDYLQRNSAIQKFIVEKGEIPPDVPAGLKALYSPSAKLFLRDVINLDPTLFAKSYRGSVLIMNGELDNQVSPTLDAPKLENAFKSGQASREKFELLPSDSHSLKKVSGPTDPGLSGPVDPNALAVLTGWLSTNL